MRSDSAASPEFLTLSDGKTARDPARDSAAGGEAGRRFGGAHPGPALLVACTPTLADALVERLSEFPLAIRIRGSVVIAQLSDAGHMAAGFDDSPALAQIVAPGDVTAVDTAFWTILRKCAALGMIDGRSLPYRGRS